MIEAVKRVGVQGLNHLLRSESWAMERLRRHAGAKFLVEGGPLNITLTIDEYGLMHLADASAAPDVTLSLPPESAVAALFERDKLFSSVKLGGAADVAESLAFVFRNLKWDAEADLARLVGDIAARRLSLFGRALAGSLGGGVRKTAENVREFIAEDSGLLAANEELNAFGRDVARLGEELASLEQRISQL